MKRLISIKSLAVVAVALGAFAAASSAQARTDVYFSVGIQAPGVYVQPRAVYAVPRPVYVQSQRVYVPALGHPGRYDRQYGERHGNFGDRNRIGIANINDYDGPRNQRRHARLYGPYGDVDRDGVANQYDRDRDGDGIRNRYDRLPNNPYRN